MKTAIRLACVAAALAGAIGCGQKGPLYLPEHTGAVVTRPGSGAQNNGSQQQPATQQPARAPQSDTPPATTSGAAKKSSDDKDDDSAGKK